MALFETRYLTQEGFIKLAAWYAGYPGGCNHCTAEGFTDWVEKIENKLEWFDSRDIRFRDWYRKLEYLGLPAYLILFCDIQNAICVNELSMLSSDTETLAKAFAAASDLDERYKLILHGGVDYVLENGSRVRKWVIPE